MQIIIGLIFLFLSSCTISTNQKIVKDHKENKSQISVFSTVKTGLTFNK